MNRLLQFFKAKLDKCPLREDDPYRTYFYGLGCYSFPKIITRDEKIRELTR